MQLSGPFAYRIRFDKNGIIGVEGPDRSTNFSGPASQKVPKLYVISHDQQPLYVGVTKQRVRDRLRLGFQANSGHGYHGYAWRHHLSYAAVDVWLQEGSNRDLVQIETVEAEVVFLIRQRFGQWPSYQTEIHFHESGATHRQAARDIIDHYQH